MPLVPSAKVSGVVKERVTSVERPGKEPEGCEFDARLLGREKSRSKDRPLLLRSDSSKNYRRGPMVPPEEGKARQEWLCYRDAGMAKHRDTSRQEAGAKPAALGNYSSRLCLPARIAEWWAIRAEERAQTEVCATAEESRRSARTPPRATELLAAERLARGCDVGRGVGQSCFA